VGLLLRRRKFIKDAGVAPRLQIDLHRPRDRRIMGFFLGGTVVFLLLAAMGSYQTYHFTESVQFCGKACHTVMKPELVTYLHSPHARVSCAECHIGKGAGWFVKSKLSGTYQVYAVAFNKYPTPVPTPIKNLRPAQDTCEQCHWPAKFVGNLERTYTSFLTDETNTEFSVRMLLKVGGSDPTHGPVGGIHYHMNVANKIEYFATDEARLKIPWVRVTNPQGVVTEFRTPGFTNTPAEKAIRRMDCIDCHNRPAHRYKSPSSAVNLAMSLGNIDPKMPWVKSNAVFALVQKYQTEDAALKGVATYLTQKYPTDQRTSKLITEVQKIYQDNFFPEMKADWSSYPEHIGHKDWLGCFRCHDGRHKSDDGRKQVTASDCDSCHTILAQGSGAELMKLTPLGQKFRHPGDEVDGACNDCHTGGL
jgi:nitrate/TMAO reductase-like tetraheme cytochrome c subunit